MPGAADRFGRTARPPKKRFFPHLVEENRILSEWTDSEDNYIIIANMDDFIQLNESIFWMPGGGGVVVRIRTNDGTA
jgi:hypothetical protein